MVEKYKVRNNFELTSPAAVSLPRHRGGMVWGEKQFRVDNSLGGNVAADCLVSSSLVVLP
ncbi:hypothetical protein J6590_091068 [Homalodisca vitripennis]|nr:hypothetical protein J6590_066871 [Homalodisca vitripennis]KAG8255505.1 hypothetical protein J6590_091068 [Homalodisca vitripennis]